MNTITFFVSCILASLALAQEDMNEEICHARPSLTCFLIPTVAETLEGEPSNVRGTMALTPFWRDDQCFTRAYGTISGLGDTTSHGMHIHERGDISIPDGSGMGGHYNPFDQEHALPGQGTRETFHVGDLGNVFPDESGVATFDILYEEPINTWALVGRGVVVHAGTDQGREAQPSGDSGARLATCVLGRLNT